MGLNILIVEHSAFTRAVLRRNLDMAAIQISNVYEAKSGKQAWEILKSEWVDLLLTETTLPDADGLDFFRRLHGDRFLREVPTIFIAADRNRRRIDQLLQMGAGAYLVKPCRPEELLGAIRRLLGKKLKDKAS